MSLTKQQLIEKINAIYSRVETLEVDIKTAYKELGDILSEMDSLPSEVSDIVDDEPESDSLQS